MQKIYKFPRAKVEIIYSLVLGKRYIGNSKYHPRNFYVNIRNFCILTRSYKRIKNNYIPIQKAIDKMQDGIEVDDTVDLDVSNYK